MAFENSPVFVPADRPGHALDGRPARRIADVPPAGGREGAVLKLGELVMILDLHRQGLSVSAIARQLGVDRKTVRAYIAKGLEPPVYKKRAARLGIVDHFEAYLGERLAAYPALTAVRLWRELKERGFAGGYSVVRDRVRELRPSQPAAFEVRFETLAGEIEPAKGGWGRPGAQVQLQISADTRAAERRRPILVACARTLPRSLCSRENFRGKFTEHLPEITGEMAQIAETAFESDLRDGSSRIPFQ